MSGPFPLITAPLPDNKYVEPIAPWRVEARPAGYGQTDPAVDLTLFRVTQDGPDEPRIMRTLPAHMTIREARELIVALTGAVEYLDAEARS